MPDDPVVLAEREYQRRLAALHTTRAELAEVDAALRRLEFDRLRPGVDAGGRETELRGRRVALADRADHERRAAQEQRDLVDRHRGAVGAEPVSLPPEPDDPPTGYVQPPFGGTR